MIMNINRPSKYITPVTAILNVGGGNTNRAKPWIDERKKNGRQCIKTNQFVSQIYSFSQTEIAAYGAIYIAMYVSHVIQTKIVAT